MKATLKMLALPIIGFALASAGAVSTSTTATSKTAMPPMTAYIHSSGLCQPVNVSCNFSGGPVCLYNGTQQAWAKGPDGQCNIRLARD